MKRFFALTAAVMMAFALVACGGDSQTESSYAGTYTCQAAESQGIFMDTAKYGITMTIVLEADGTGTIASMGDPAYEMEWTVDGNTITFSDDIVSIKCKIEDSMIIVEVAGFNVYLVKDGHSLPNDIQEQVDNSIM